MESDCAIYVPFFIFSIFSVIFSSRILQGKMASSAALTPSPTSLEGLDSAKTPLGVSDAEAQSLLKDEKVPFSLAFYARKMASSPSPSPYATAKRSQRSVSTFYGGVTVKTFSTGQNVPNFTIDNIFWVGMDLARVP